MFLGILFFSSFFLYELDATIFSLSTICPKVIASYDNDFVFRNLIITNYSSVFVHFRYAIVTIVITSKFIIQLLEIVQIATSDCIRSTQ